MPTDHFTRAAGIRAVDKLIASGTPFDALFCFNDLLALGAIESLQQHGRAVPGDVAVVGFDDIDEGRHTSPDLTTVAVDLAVLAEAAVDSLVRRLDDPSAPDGDSSSCRTGSWCAEARWPRRPPSNDPVAAPR